MRHRKQGLALAASQLCVNAATCAPNAGSQTYIPDANMKTHLYYADAREASARELNVHMRALPGDPRI